MNTTAKMRVVRTAARDKISTGRRLLPDGVDLPTRSALRFRYLVKTYMLEFGDNLSGRRDSDQAGREPVVADAAGGCAGILGGEDPFRRAHRGGRDQGSRRSAEVWAAEAASH
jgi:hypothetical protein